jgi:hypothetical protein
VITPVSMPPPSFYLIYRYQVTIMVSNDNGILNDTSSYMLLLKHNLEEEFIGVADKIDNEK